MYSTHHHSHLIKQFLLPYFSLKMQGAIIIANFKVPLTISHYLSMDVVTPTLYIIIMHKDHTLIYNPIAKTLDYFIFNF